MQPLIAGNWKMHDMATQLGEIEEVATSVLAVVSCIAIGHADIRGDHRKACAYPRQPGAAEVGCVLVGGVIPLAADFNAVGGAARSAALMR